MFLLGRGGSSLRNCWIFSICVNFSVFLPTVSLVRPHLQDLGDAGASGERPVPPQTSHCCVLLEQMGEPAKQSAVSCMCVRAGLREQGMISSLSGMLGLLHTKPLKKHFPYILKSDPPYKEVCLLNLIEVIQTERRLWGSGCRD